MAVSITSPGSGDKFSQAGQGRERLAQCDQFPRADSTHANIGRNSVDLCGLGEQFPNFGQAAAIGGEFLDRILARDDIAVASQRESKPPLQQACSHSGGCPVQARQQRSGAVIRPQRTRYFQASQRVAVDDHVPGPVELA